MRSCSRSLTLHCAALLLIRIPLIVVQLQDLKAAWQGCCSRLYGTAFQKSTRKPGIATAKSEPSTSHKAAAVFWEQNIWQSLTANRQAPSAQQPYWTQLHQVQLAAVSSAC